MKILDFEAHYALPEAFTLKSRQLSEASSSVNPASNAGGPLAQALYDLEEVRLSELNACGVTAQMLSHQNGIELADPAEGVLLARAANDRIYTLAQAHPGRFGGYATLAVNDVEASLAELERCITELGFVGWNTYSNYGDLRLDDEKYRPLLAKAAELGACVYLHPAAPPPSMAAYHGLGSMLWGALGYSADACLTLVRMIAKGIFDELPNLKLILGHLGEGLPFLLTRLDPKNGKDGPHPGSFNIHAASYYFRHNIWVTMSGNFSLPAFRCAREVLGLERILFGSDYPMERLSKAVDFLKSLPISAADRERLAWANAAENFRCPLAGLS